MTTAGEKSRAGAGWLLCAIVVLVAALHLITLREGHDWGGDFSHYMHHAKNLAEGRDYGDTGYIYNPHHPTIGPPNYPPVFPLLLTPAYMLRGPDLDAMKTVNILCFLVFLVVFYLALKDEFPRPYLIASVAIIGSSPYFLDLTDKVISAVPFLLFVYLSFLCIGHAQRGGGLRDRGVLVWAILSGLSIFFAYGVRSLGVLLLPCVLLCARGQRGDQGVGRERRSATALILAVAGFLIMVQTVFLPSGDGYFVLIRDSISTHTDDPGSVGVILNFALDNVEKYLRSLLSFWENGYSIVLGLALFASITGLAMIGLARRIRRGPTIFEYFLVIYSVTLIFLPFAQARYAIPLLPLYVLYSFEGLGVLRCVGGCRLESGAAIGLILAIAFSFAGAYSKADFGDIAEGVGKKETKELFAFVDQETSVDDTFLFIKPRVLAFYTGRKASVYHAAEEDGELWSYISAIGATHLIVGPPLFDRRPMAEFIRDFVRRNRDSLDRSFSNPDFEVYRLPAVEGQR